MTESTFYTFLALQALFNLTVLAALLLLFGRKGPARTVEARTRTSIPAFSAIGTITREAVNGVPAPDAGRPGGGATDAATAQPDAGGRDIPDPASVGAASPDGFAAHLGSLLAETRQREMQTASSSRRGWLRSRRASKAVAAPPHRTSPWGPGDTALPSGESVLDRTLAQMRRRVPRSA